MLTFTRTTWNVTAPSSLTAGSGTVSPQSTSGETAPQSSQTLIACSDGPGVRVGSLRGRACSTNRSSDGPAERAPMGSGGAP
jgi:hypothetical protein